MLRSSMEEDKKMFEDILDEGEVIKGVMRPNKKKYWAYFNWSIFWVYIWLIVVVAAIPLSMLADEEVTSNNVLWGFIISLGGAVILTIIGYIISFIFARLTYNKRYYAFTDKRIIIRCGTIGTDYRVLDYKMLGATTVTVGILDRIMGGKTGYISFGSASSPIYGVTQARYGFGAGYVFSHIDKPYELLKEIKAIINTAQSKEK